MSLTYDEFHFKVLALLTEAEANLKTLYGDVHFDVSTQDLPYGLNLVLTASFKNISEPLSDAVELVITRHDVHNSINADVIWTHPYSHSDAEFSEKDAALTPDNLQKLYDDLPRLIRIFESAAQRGNKAMI